MARNLDLSQPIWTSELVSRIERCATAIATLNARVSVSFAAHAWRRRAAWTGYAAALQGQGAELDEIDIFARACEVKVPGRVVPPSHYDDPQDLPRWMTSLRTSGEHWRDSAGFSTSLPDDRAKRPAFLRALEILARHARADHSVAPWLAFPRVLQSMKITASPLPCLVPVDRSLRMPVREPDAVIKRYLRSLTEAAEVGLSRLQFLEEHRVRAAAALRDAHRPGRLGGLLAFIMHKPVVSPRIAAREFNLSLSGAGKLLARTAELGLLVEFTGRKAWRVYVVTDLAYAFGFQQRPRGRPEGPPKINATLEPALAWFDREMEEVDAMLVRLGVDRPLNADPDAS